MRIRKRFQNPLLPPDLSAAAAVAVAEGAAGGEEGEVAAAAAAVLLHGLGDRGGGGGGRRLHPNGDLPAQPFQGCTKNPTFCLPFHPPPPEAATAPAGKGSGDLPSTGAPLFSRDMPLDHGRGGEVAKREQDGKNGGGGDVLWGRNMDAHTGFSSGTAAAKSSGAEAPQLSLGHSGYNTPPDGVAAEAEVTARWSDEERGHPRLKKRRGCCRVQRGRSVAEEDQDNAAAEKEMKPRLSKTSRRATTSTNIMAQAASLTTTGCNGSGGAPASAGAGAGAANKYRSEAVVKEEAEGGDVMPVEGAAAMDGDRGGGGKGKKRRRPAVLMEGSRCSRVNGRGWRCCQQTLVGYSLCEHHLGKGRLRSVSSVRCNGRARKKEEAEGAALSLPPPVQQKQQLLSSWDGDAEEENPVKRRRRKIGVVKARSISSLLHQPDYSAPTAMAPPSPSQAPATGIVITAAPASPHDNDSAVW